MKITFQGYSDDTFGWTRDDGAGDNHDDCANGIVRTYAIESGGYRLAVTGVYGRGCMWSVGIAPIEDDDPVPPWPMRWSFDGYSTVLEIDFSDGAPTPAMTYPSAKL